MRGSPLLVRAYRRAGSVEWDIQGAACFHRFVALTCDLASLQLEDPYLSVGDLARHLGVSPHFIARITGSIFMFRGNESHTGGEKLNVGLNIKFRRTGEELLGFSRKESEDVGQWTFSERVRDLLEEYRKK